MDLFVSLLVGQPVRQLWLCS